MKRVAVIMALLALNAHGYLLTEDIPNLMQNISSFIRQGLQYSTEMNTYTTELRQLENQILEMERLGDPGALTHLPGVQEIAQLAQIYRQAQYDVAQIQGMVTESQCAINANGILSRYGLTGFDSWTSPMGVTITAPVSQFETSNYNVTQTVIHRIQSLTDQKTILTQERDAAVQALQGATDDATVAKEQAIITALNGSIADIDASIHQTEMAGQLQIGANQNAQNISNSMNGAWNEAAFQRAMEGGSVPWTSGTNLDGRVSGTSTEFGYLDNPALGGSGDPGTTGDWHTGAAGQQIATQSANYVSLPAATETAWWGSTSAAQNQEVTAINNVTGTKIYSTIGDVGPGKTAVNNGVVADLSYGTVQKLGISHGGTGNVTILKGHQ